MGARARWLSGVELALGAGLIVGHNVFRVLPNEVLILAAVGVLSLRLRSGSWTAAGLGPPAAWRAAFAIAAAAAVLRIALGELVAPLAERWWGPIAVPDGADEITGNLQTALTVLLLVWTFAAVGEELGYRGYLLRRAAELMGGSTWAWWAAVAITATLFGLGHYYKGPAGMLDSGIAGFILGAVYLRSGRNLWACVLAHGFIDTVGVIAIFFGLDS
jgi:membrane protease YdiL (CAAX protease family)